MLETKSVKREPTPSDLMKKAEEALDAKAKAAVIGAVLNGNGVASKPDEKEALEAEKLKLENTNLVSSIYERVLKAQTEDNERLRRDQGQSYEAGREDAKAVAAVEMSALEKSHQMSLEFLKAMNDERTRLMDALREEREAALRAQQEIQSKFSEELQRLRDELRAQREQELQHRIDELTKKIEEAKSSPASSQAKPVDGQHSNNGRYGGVRQLVEDLRELQAARSSLVEALGVPTTVDPANDPELRWKHKTIDWIEEEKSVELESKRKLSEAKVKVEEARAKAWERLVPTLEKAALPWIRRAGAVMTGAAVEREARNGIPAEPPSLGGDTTP